MIGHYSLRIAFECYVVKSGEKWGLQSSADYNLRKYCIYLSVNQNFQTYFFPVFFDGRYDTKYFKILKCQPVSTNLHMTYENEINNWQNSLLLQILIRSEQYFLFSFKNFRIIICKLKIKYALFSKIWESVTYNWVCLTIVKLCDISNVLHLPLKNDQ